MSAEQDLWDWLDADRSKEDWPARAQRDQARRERLRRVRTSGHWLLLLRVARTIPQPFTLNDISVAVWKACPDFFSMKGYPYPDNHKVHSILYGDRGLIAKGLLLRVRRGLFQVPDGLDPDQLLAAAADEEK
jgi:hypothetical protein